jgi:hypothetical protein
LLGRRCGPGEVVVSQSSDTVRSAPASFGRSAGRLAAVAALVAVALAAVSMYVRTLGYDLVFDDLSLIGPDGPRRLGNEALAYRPLRYVSYRIDFLWGGGRAGAYHATNVLLHALVSVGVVDLARRFGATALVACIAGLAFALHPLGVEVAAYVAGRRDLLSTLFGLAALSFWTRERAVASTVFLLASVAAKESGLLFLPLLALASRCGAGPAPGLGVRILLPASVAAIALPAAYGAVGPFAPSTTLAHQIAVAARLAAHYAAGMIWPVALSVEYPALLESEIGGSAGPSLGAGVLAGVVLLLFRELLFPRKRSFGACAAAVVFLALCFVIGAHEPGVDRHAYPLVAFVALAAAQAFRRLPLSMRKPAFVAALGLVVWFAVLTHRRIPVWADETSLWSATVAAAPDSVRANHNLAGVRIEEGDLLGARRLLARARRNDPEYAPAFLGQALIDCMQGRRVRGERWLAKARVRGANVVESERIAEVCRSPSKD